MTPTTSTSKSSRFVGDTITKSRFFHAIDMRNNKPIIQVCKEEKISYRTGKYWLRQRRILGTPIASQKSRREAAGRPSKLSDDQLDQLLDVANPVRNQPYECQIQHFGFDVHPRTLQKNLTTRRHYAKRYKMAKVKEISPKNKKERVRYAEKHKDETVQSFWQYVHWIDEAHIDPSMEPRQYILREEGTRLQSENMQEMKETVGVRYHIAASVSWHHKGLLQFYNDENDPPEIKIPKPKKPRKSKYETDEQYNQRVKEWEASLPHDVEAKPKGNAMIQIYYTERLLPIHLQSYNEARMIGRKAILQEDNDPSHGTRSKDNLAKRFKEDNCIDVLIHPAQSPDLNPIEAVWNILKIRLHKERWNGRSDYKRLILKAWEDITQEEIQRRIAEMPDRCKSLLETGGKAIKSARW